MKALGYYALLCAPGAVACFVCFVLIPRSLKRLREYPETRRVMLLEDDEIAMKPRKGD